MSERCLNCKTPLQDSKLFCAAKCRMAYSARRKAAKIKLRTRVRVGQQYGQLKVLGRADQGSYTNVRWTVQCLCGSEPFEVFSSALVNGDAARRKTSCAACAAKSKYWQQCRIDLSLPLLRDVSAGVVKQIVAAYRRHFDANFLNGAPPARFEDFAREALEALPEASRPAPIGAIEPRWDYAAQYGGAR